MYPQRGWRTPTAASSSSFSFPSRELNFASPCPPCYAPWLQAQNMCVLGVDHGLKPPKPQAKINLNKLIISGVCYYDGKLTATPSVTVFSPPLQFLSSQSTLCFICHSRVARRYRSPSQEAPSQDPSPISTHSCSFSKTQLMSHNFHETFSHSLTPSTGVGRWFRKHWVIIPFTCCLEIS